MTELLDALRKSGRTFSQQPAIVSRSGQWSYSQLIASLNDAQGQLDAFGIGPGVRVGVISAGGASGLFMQLLCMSSATAVPLNPELPASALAEQANRAALACVLVDCSLALEGRIKHLPVPTFSCELDEKAKTFQISSATEKTSFCFQRTDADVALILHTSGSTGLPKQVPLSAGQIVAAGENLCRSLSLSNQDRVLNLMPQFHVGALVDLLVAPLLSGGSVVTAQGFSAEEFFNLARKWKPTWFQAVPTMCRDLLDYARVEAITPPNGIRLVRSVSSSLPQNLYRELESFFDAPVIEIYGMSETCGLIASNPLPPGARKPGSVGLPHGMDIRIRDGSGNPCGAGVRGEIEVRGKTLMRGYSDNQAKEFHNGWFSTGDEGFFDHDGYLFLCGRIKESINRGGEKISPIEVDQATMQFQGIKEAACFAIPHPTLGEDIAMAIVLNEGQTFDCTRLHEFLRVRLPPHMIPRKIIPLAALPRAPGGKLQRNRLQAMIKKNIAPENRGRVSLDKHQKTIAKSWSQVLDVNTIHSGDNFFDLGGDSLRTLRLVSLLKKQGFQSASAALLYEYPVFADFAARLNENSANKSLEEKDLDESGKLPDQIEKTLSAYISQWQGERKTPETWICGRNTESGQTPLFWCVNGFREFDSLASCLPAERPVYGLRSLFMVPGRRPEYIPLVCDRYLREIKAIQPHGPYLLGGFCEGAKFAMELAERLRHQGEKIALLALHEQFVPRPFPAPVAMYVCPSGDRNWTRYFLDPEKAWRGSYYGSLVIRRLENNHADCYRGSAVVRFSAMLERDMVRALEGSLPGEKQHPEKRLSLLKQDVMKAEIAISGPRIIRAGSKATFRIKVRNIGNDVWMPEDKSGIMLGCRWLRHNMRPKYPLAGYTRLQAKLKPGASATLTITAQAPDVVSLRRLQFDVFQDGVTWFSDAEGEFYSRRLLVI